MDADELMEMVDNEIVFECGACHRKTTHVIDLNAKVLPLDLHEVITNSDTTEGRGLRVTIGFFTDRARALQKGKGMGVMGTDADLKLHQAEPVVMIGKRGFVLGREINVAPLTHDEKRSITKEALKKLTDLELEALGLTRS